jgi:hypothetical protein
MKQTSEATSETAIEEVSLMMVTANCHLKHSTPIEPFSPSTRWHSSPSPKSRMGKSWRPCLHGAQTSECRSSPSGSRLHLEQERIGYDLLRAVLRGLQTATSKEYLTVQRRRSLHQALLCNDATPMRLRCQHRRSAAMLAPGPMFILRKCQTANRDSDPGSPRSFRAMNRPKHESGPSQIHRPPLRGFVPSCEAIPGAPPTSTWAAAAV